jgi:hypothetical protein
MLLSALFRDGTASDVRLRGASFDAQSYMLTLDIEGDCVPDSKEVVADVAIERFAVEFRAA